MDLQQHYQKLYDESIEKYRKGNYQLDNLIDSATDRRFGITLLIRPPQKIKTQMGSVLQAFKSIEPKQYYYPDSDIHITVMSIISCYEGFELTQIDRSKYITIIQKCLEGIKPFSIEFKGLTASPSCLMVQGLMCDNALTQIRDHLRYHFKNSSLQHSIDKRYAIQTAHSTILRLKENLANKEAFVAIMEKYKDFEFGAFTVDTLELVYNDWYQREARVKKLHEFKLP